MIAQRLMGRGGRRREKALIIPSGGTALCSTPDSATYPLTGSFEIILAFTPTSVSGTQNIARKWEGSGTRQFIIGIVGANVTFIATKNGATVLQRTGTLNEIAAGQRTYIKIKRIKNASLVVSLSSDGVSWQTSFEASGALILDDFFNSSEPLRIGGTVSPFAGKIHRLTAYDNNTLAFDFDPNLYAGGSTLLGRAGETWTLSGGATIEDI